MTALLLGILFFGVWGTYEKQLGSCALKTVSKDASHAHSLTSGAVSMYFGCGMSHAPGLLNVCDCDRAEVRLQFSLLTELAPAQMNWGCYIHIIN